MKRHLIIFSIALLLASCAKETVLPLAIDQTDLAKEIDQLILEKIVRDARLFNWDEQDDDFLCRAIPLTDDVFVVGVDQNENGRENLANYLSLHDEEMSLLKNDAALGTYHIKASNCDHIAAIRQLAGIEYIELNYFPSDISSLLDQSLRLPAEINSVASRSGTPGNYVVGSMPYLDYLDAIDGGTARRARLHQMAQVYDEFNVYGAGVGIAVIDNGVHQEDMPYFQESPGGFNYTGYYTPNWYIEDAPSDGPHPRPADIQGLWQLISPSYGHGTGMTENAYALAPFAHIHSMRASPTYIILFPSQFTAMTKAITAAADDDNVKVVSMSMAGPFSNNQVKSAIRYLNSKNKIMVCAAGSSLPILKDLLKVLFPAKIPETISVTGLEPTEEHNGNFLLGLFAHGGPQNDFVVDDASSSSTGTSTFAGMMATLWSINPDLDREILIDILKQNSNYYQSLGHKHGKFGWGKVDMYEAALDVQETL